MATTLEANTGAASSAPSNNQVSNSTPCSASTTTRRKSSGLSTGARAKPVTSEAEVTTQPVPANASRMPNTIRRPSLGFQVLKAVASVAGSPRSRARLTA